MKYRHEIKYSISPADVYSLRARLSAVCNSDSHARGGVYDIYSLYFDNLRDKALREKLDGVNRREKFRLRFYNGDTSFIKLEKKMKHNSLCMKLSEQCPTEAARSLSSGEPIEPYSPLTEELVFKMKNELLRPKTIVRYRREPYVFAPGNVRVTIDSDIRTGILCTDFLNVDSPTVSVRDSSVILEVKWDEFLPDIIADAVGIDRRASAYSKYAVSRVYG